MNPVAGVSLRPNDPFAKKLSSTAYATQNVLIKVTIPKRTGRKRKGGSDEPFIEDPAAGSNDSITVPSLLQRLRDNDGNYNIQAVGTIKDTHRFTGLPDFQVRADDVPIMRELRDHAMQPDYEKLRAFNINFNPSINASAAFPGPPSFSRSTGLVRDSERSEVSRPQAKQPKAQPSVGRKKTASFGNTFQQLDTPLDTDSVPQGPPQGLPIQQQGLVPLALQALEEILADRPIVSVRAFHTLRDGHTSNSLRAAIPYLGYYMHSGPWAHTVAKYGIDPRKDPAMRKYQTLSLSNKGMSTVDIPPQRRAEVFNEHIFDGTLIGVVSKIWQLCDLTDPTLQHIINTDDIRGTCDPEQLGWYHNGTMSKLRAIAREKMMRVTNNQPPLPETEYMALADLPNSLKETSDYDHNLFENGSWLRSTCIVIARDAVYRTREASAGGGPSSTPEDLYGDGEEGDEGFQDQQDGDLEDEDYAPG